MAIKPAKERIKQRIRISNERVQHGLPPDPWVVNYRAKNNATKARWKSTMPEAVPVKRVANSGSFKRVLTDQERMISRENAIKKSNSKRATEIKQWHKENKSLLSCRLKLRRKTDVAFRIKCNLRKRLSFLLRKSIAEKTKQTLNLLGCDMQFFMSHLQSQFKPGMSFDNYGHWHLDHKTPCSSFDLTKESEQEKCFHYTNIQPLWSTDNRQKSDKIL